MTVLGQYVDSHTKVEVQCNTCDHRWHATPANLLKGTSCPECARQMHRIDCATFVALLEEKNPSVKLVGEYICANNRILFHCKICDGTWMATPHAVLSNGTGCPDCAGAGTSFFEQALRFTLSDIVGEDGVISRDRKTHEAFVSQLAKVNPTIEPIDRYAGARTKIRFRCLECGNEWMVTPDNVLRGKGCPPCKKRGRKKKS